MTMCNVKGGADSDKNLQRVISQLQFTSAVQSFVSKSHDLQL